MFVDSAKIIIKAGNGGNGSASFHRAKYIRSGGPDGGDGGRGGDIFFITSDNISTLSDFRYKKIFKAENGQDGRANKSSGKRGKDLIIKVPKGTLIKDAKSGKILADIFENKLRLMAKGGRGGWGNIHFKSSIRQAPKFAKPGGQGQEKEVVLELKLLADVCVIGFPSVGKSTLICGVSNAKPEVADYHFTTLNPVLGVVNFENVKPFVIADMPGLIKDAKHGVGLGHKFLKHIERCRLFIHMVDVSESEGRNSTEDFETILNELYSFNKELKERKMVVAGNKCDQANLEQVEKLKKYVEKKGYVFFVLSVKGYYGIHDLMKYVSDFLPKLPAIKKFEEEVAEDEIKIEYVDRKDDLKITKKDGFFYVESNWIRKMISSINLDYEETFEHFCKILNREGVMKVLKKSGVKNGDLVYICDIEIIFEE